MPRTSRRIPLAICIVLFLINLVGGAYGRDLGRELRRASEVPWCGLTGHSPFAAIEKHYEFRMLAPAHGLAARAAPERAAVSRDIGNIAVIEGDATIIQPANPLTGFPFNIRFTPSGSSAYTISKTASSLDSDVGTKLNLQDDDSVQVNLPFTFIFYGQSHNSLFVNSDGNLTFGVGDSASTARSVRRFARGAPRIAPLFEDFDPADRETPPDGGVFNKLLPDRAVFTWKNVTRFREAGRPFLANAFQVTLFANGAIEFGYGTINSREGVVGISPGGADSVTAVDYDNPPAGPISGAIAEVFKENVEVDIVALAQRFYQTHPDDFDFLVLFGDFNFDLDGAFAFAQFVSNNVRGIGYRNIVGTDTFNLTSLFGSAGRLQTFVQMGPLANYPDDPFVNIPGLGTNNTLDVLGQEIGHRWGAFVRFRSGGVDSDLLLGRDNSHWSFFHDTDASELEGNDIEDLGNGEFQTVAATERYSPLDQYLMGLRAASEVPSFFFVDNPSGTTRTRSSSPRIGERFMGTRRDLSIDDIIAAEGARDPDASVAPKTFTGAFILLVEQGKEPSQASLDKLERIRSSWETFFTQATGGRGSFVATLSGQPVPPGPAVKINFPIFRQSESQWSGYAILNRSASTARVTFSAFNATGDRVRGPSTLTIGPRQQLAILGNQIFNMPQEERFDGWIQAESSTAEISSFFLMGDFAQTFLDGAVADDKAFKQLVFTRVVQGAVSGRAASTELVVVNPGDQAARLQIRLFDEAGRQLGSTATREIRPRGRLAEGIASLFPNVTVPQSGAHVEIDSDTDVVGLEVIVYAPDTIAVLPAQPPGQSTSLFSPHLASGGTGFLPSPFFTELNLANPTDTPIKAKISVIDDQGNLIRLSPFGGNPRDVTVPPRGAIIGTADQLFLFPPAQNDRELRVGAIIVEADRAGLVGDVLFGEARNLATATALPLLAGNALATSAAFSHLVEGAVAGIPYFTGIAVFNPNQTAVAVTVSVFDRQGRQVGSSASIGLGPRQRTSRLLSELVPESADLVGGYILLAATGGVATFEIFGDDLVSRFNAAVPAQPIK